MKGNGKRKETYPQPDMAARKAKGGFHEWNGRRADGTYILKGLTVEKNSDCQVRQRTRQKGSKKCVNG